MKKKDFMPIDDLENDSANSFLNPNTILLSKNIIIGKNNLFYPNVYIEATENSKLEIGNDNVFYPNTFILADRGGITIGDNNIFENNINIKANTEDAFIEIKNNCRFLNNITISGKCYFGKGSQVIGGFITLQNCSLEDGESYQSSKVENRGGVLKGFGIAKNISIKKGFVLNGNGLFQINKIEPQTNYHKSG